MKIVQGVHRQYQLVEKTKKKDIDGIVYLVAGERNLWVKLLKDKSPAKREQISRMIGQGSFAGFEKPLEMVNDAKGSFAGYTFRGAEMQIVPEKNMNKPDNPGICNPDNEFPGMDNPGLNPPAGGLSGMEMPKSAHRQEPRREISGSQKWLVLLILGVLLFLFMKGVLNNWLLIWIYRNISWTIGDGCTRFSFDGILPGIVGIAGMLWFQKGFGFKMNSLGGYCLMAVLFFLGGAVLTYAVTGVICAFVVGIFGVVKTYQTVIVGVLILAFLAKLLLSSK